MSRLFNCTTQFYKAYESIFNEIENIYISSEDLIADIGRIELENLTYEQRAFPLILTRNKKLLISILVLCCEGHGEDAGVLLRSLFESYIHMEYMKKHNLAERYLKYITIASKTSHDKMKKYGFTKEIENDEKYRNYVTELLKKYDEVKDDFTNRKGKIINKWAKKDLRAMAIDIDRDEVANFIKSENLSVDPEKVYGEKQVNYELLYEYHSDFVHCNPFSQGSFVKGQNNKIEFDCSPSLKDIEIVLIRSKIIYSRIVALWIKSFNKQPSNIILRNSEIILASPYIINKQ